MPTPALQSSNNPASGAQPSYTPLPANGLPAAPITFGTPALPSTATKTVVTAAPAVQDLQAKQANVQAATAAAAAPKPVSGITPAAGYMVDPNNPNGVIPIPTGQPAQTNQPTQTNPQPSQTSTPTTPAPPNSTTAQLLNLIQSGNVSVTADQMKQIAGLDATGFKQNPDGTFTPDSSAISRVDTKNNYTPSPTGTTGDPTQDYINSQRATLDQQAQTSYDNYTQQLSQIANGSFPLTASQQAQYNALQNQFEQLRQSQLLANQNYTGAITNLGIRAGRSRYAPEIEQGQIQSAINLGISKISAIDSQAATALANLQQGFQDNNYKLINAQYSALQDLMKSKNDSLAAMQQTIKDQLDAQTQKLQQQQALQSIETTTIGNVAQAAMTDALNADGSINFDAIQKTADSYGVDVNQLYSAVLKQKDAYTLQQQSEQKFTSDQAQAAAQLGLTQAQTKKTYNDINIANLNAPNGNGQVVGTTGNSTIDATAQGYTTQNVAGGLTQASIDQKALSYLTSGTLPPQGRTGVAGQQNAAISNRMAELDPNGNLAANKTQLKALSSSLTQQTNYLNSTQRAFNTATDNLATLKTFMEKAGVNTDSSVPLLNSIQNGVKGGLLDPGTVAGYEAAIAGLRAEYAQVLSRGGEVTDGQRNAASNLIPDNLTPAQLQQVADRLNAEGTNAVGQAQAQVQSIQTQISGLAGTTSTSGSSSGFTPRGSTSANDFVAKTFATLYPGKTETQVIDENKSKLQAGESLAFDNNTGDIVGATADDLASGNYTPL